MTTTYPSKYTTPQLTRYPSNSSILKDIPPLKEPILHQVNWDPNPTRDLFQQLIDEFDSRRQSPLSLSPEKIMEIQEPFSAQISTQGCKCSKIGCLKLYCECFTRGEICGPACSCIACENCVGHEGKIVLAQQMANFRKPGSFAGVTPWVPQRKCTCKKSKCQKKYCECFNAGVKCSENCECSGCENHGHGQHGHGHGGEEMLDKPMRMEIETPA